VAGHPGSPVSSLETIGVHKGFADRLIYLHSVVGAINASNDAPPCRYRFADNGPSFACLTTIKSIKPEKQTCRRIEFYGSTGTSPETLSASNEKVQFEPSAYYSRPIPDSIEIRLILPDFQQEESRDFGR
jgi:hypothetical protein